MRSIKFDERNERNKRYNAINAMNAINAIRFLPSAFFMRYEQYLYYRVNNKSVKYG